MAVANTLAYYVRATIMAFKSFIALALRVKIIKPFLAVINSAL